MTNRAIDPADSWRLGDRWRNTRAVLADGWPAVVVVVGVVTACVIGYIWPRQTASTAFAIAGVVLQWAGLAVVALGMVQMRQRFKRPTWFRRLWGALQRPVYGSANITLGLAGVSARGTAGGVGTLANPTTEERLNALEAGLTRLRTDLKAEIQTVTTSIETVKQDVQREAAARTAAITDVLRQVEDVSAGGLHLQSIGLWWLVVGVLFTSVPNELATLLGPFLTL